MPPPPAPDARNEEASPELHRVPAQGIAYLLSIVVLALSLVATYGLWDNARDEAEGNLRTEFDFQAREAVRRIEQRMATYEQVARGTEAFLLGSFDIKRDDYRLFVESLRLPEKFPGIQGLAVAQLVMPPAVDRHVEAVRAEGFPGYAIKPPGPREVYSAITHIEPFTGLNLRALGFDMLSEPIRRAAMERARDTGQAAASGKVKLIQENGVEEQAGLVMYLPVYKRGATTFTLEERRANLIGWIGAPFRMNDLMAGIGGERSGDFFLTIYDGEKATPEAQMFRSRTAETEEARTHASRFNAQHQIAVAGRPWTFRIGSSPHFEQRLDTGKQRLIAVAGTGASIMLALLVWTLASARRRALLLAAGMTRQLRASEFRWKYALEGAGDGVWDWNNETGEIVYSQRWKEMLGYSDAELPNLTDTWNRLLHPEDKPSTYAAVDDYLNGKTPTYVHEFRLRCKDGSWKWILARAMAVNRGPDGEVWRTIGTHTDISRAKEQEAALRESNERLAAERNRVKIILENSHDAFVAIDAKGIVTDWNAKAEKTFGWTADQAIGRRLTDLIVPPDMRDAHDAGFNRYLASGKTTVIDRVVELEAIDRDGKTVPVELAVAGYTEESGRAVSAFIRDISERKEAQRLEAERSHALDEARLSLHHAQKLEAVGKLTGGVAHDFNNVLQIIGGNIQLMQYQYADQPALQKRLGNMLEAVDRGSKLSSQLLAFARRQPLQPVIISPARIIANMEDLLQRALGESITLTGHATEGLWNIFVDPGQLENVVLNLALNARDAMPAGGNVDISMNNVSLNAADLRLQPDLSAGDYVVLAVKDTGIGMSAEVAEQAFEPFFTTKPEGQGTGLGLSMAYGFVKQSGGHIRIDSKPGQGTTVEIYLPRSARPEALAPAQATGATVGGSETILVVEDDPGVQAAVVGMLQDLGYHVLKADNGDEALTIVESEAPIDLLFTDVVMPGTLSSPDLAQKARQARPQLAVLFTSGYTRNALVSGGRLADGVELLSKPYRREQLAQKIREVLAQQAAATASLPI